MIYRSYGYIIDEWGNKERRFKTPQVVNDWIGNYDIPAWSLHRLIEMYVERYISCSVNIKDLTYEWLINEIEIHIKEGDFNKEYLI